jgi:catechol 2,3-dioxygenase-like lactoylglutathione lyase family enzyme
MYSHIFIGVTDFARAHHFYAAVMDALGLEQRFIDASKPWAGWHCEGKSRPFLVIGHPFNGQAHSHGNGQMIALAADDWGAVQRAHAAALASGGSCEGAPGLRPHYHTNYYGAYFRDPDANKLGVACHVPTSQLKPTT